MKSNYFLICLFFLCIIPFNATGQQEQAEILKTPMDWRLEKITLPLDFAPQMKLEGVEELRFAPGMFDSNSENHFTYLFAIAISNKRTFKKKDIQLFLEQYYRGLSKVVAQGVEKELDFSKINVSIQRDPAIKSNGKNYNIKVLYLDTFNHGEEVLLNVDMNVICNKKKKETYLFAKVSPQPKNHAVWNTMHNVTPSF